MNYVKKIFCLIIALLFVPSITVQASLPAFPANDAVLDTQNVLSSNTVQTLVSGNNRLFTQTGGEVLFYITDFLPMGYTVSDFTLELFNYWQVGSEQNNNGVLVVMALATTDHHITVGGGLANHMSGGYLHEITHNYFIDYFDAGNYDAAVNSLFNVLSAEIERIFAPAPEAAANPAPYQPVQNQNPIQQNAPRGNNNWLIIAVVVFVLFLLLPRRRRGFGGGMFGRRRMGGGGMIGGMLGGYMLGRARHRQPTVRQPRTQAPRNPLSRPPTGGGFTRGGSSGGFGGGRSGGGFTRGGSSRGGGYGGRRR